MRALLPIVFCIPTLAVAEDITLQNLVRAESDFSIRATLQTYDLDVGELFHVREIASANAPQPVIRPNQDTLYSGVVVDLSEPVSVTLPETGDRFQSLLVISQDHYNFGYASAGSYALTEEEVGTRFALLLFRTFIDASDPEDAPRAHAAQDGIVVEGGGPGPFEAPDWDLEDLAEARQAVNDLAAAVGLDITNAFGRRGEVDPIDHLVGAVSGWGGQPATTAGAIVDSVERNDGVTPHAVTVKDVPVDAFWSVTVYDETGFLIRNDLDRNSFNQTSATPNEDGSYALHFGACDDGRINCIPIAPDWNYTIRLYEPRQAILDGSWVFPAIEPVP